MKSFISYVFDCIGFFGTNAHSVSRLVWKEIFGRFLSKLELHILDLIWMGHGELWFDLKSLEKSKSVESEYRMMLVSWNLTWALVSFNWFFLTNFSLFSMTQVDFVVWGFESNWGLFQIFFDSMSTLLPEPFIKVPLQLIPRPESLMTRANKTLF